jgi:hypothetical protein
MSAAEIGGHVKLGGDAGRAQEDTAVSPQEPVGSFAFRLRAAPHRNVSAGALTCSAQSLAFSAWHRHGSRVGRVSVRLTMAFAKAAGEVDRVIPAAHHA